MTEAMRRNFKYRLYPSPEQVAFLQTWQGVLRFLWNLCLEQRLMGIARPKDERIFPSYYDQKREMTLLLDDNPWIADVQCSARQEILADLDKAWARCFKKIEDTRLPRWKNRRDPMRIYAPSSTVPFLLGGEGKKSTITFHGPRYAPLGPLRIVLDRPLPEGRVTSWNIISDRVGDWFAVAACDTVAEPAQVPVNDQAIGLRRSLSAFLHDSEGSFIESIATKRELERRITRAQRVMDRRQKGSKNREKARRRLAKLHRLAARRREALIGAASKHYAESFGTIVVDKLDLKDMTKSKKGRASASAAIAKADVNSKILDNGWGAFTTQLKYKVEERGGKFIAVAPALAKVECPSCQSIDTTVTEETLSCTACGFTGRPEVAHAKNVLRRGIETLKAGVEPKAVRKIFSRGRKKKPPSGDQDL